MTARLREDDIRKMVAVMNGIYSAAVELEKQFISVSKSISKQNEKIAIGEEILTLASTRMQESKVMAQKTQKMKRDMDRRNCFFSTIIILIIIIGAGCSIGYLWSLFDK